MLFRNGQNDGIRAMPMRFFVSALLSLAALFFVLVTSAKDNNTIHIGARTPPAESGCRQIGQEKTDEGRLLGIYSCPA